MAYMRVHCGYCGGTWEVYRRTVNDEAARVCPHCESKIDGQTWERSVKPAFAAVHGANAELYKDHAHFNNPLFYFDVEADHIFRGESETDDSDPLAERLASFEAFIRGE